MLDEKPTEQGAVLQRLLGYLSPFRATLWVILVLIVITAATQAAAPALIGRAIDVSIAQEDRSGFATTMLLLAAVYVVGFIARAGQIYLIGTVGQRFLSFLRRDVFNKVQALPLAFFDQQRAGDLMSRLVNDIQVINQLLSQGLTPAIGSFFALIGIIIAMLVLSPVLALASFVFIPIIIWVTLTFSRLSRRAFRITREAMGNVSAGLQEDIGGIRVTQAMNRTDDAIQRFAQRNAANRDANVQAVALTAAFTPAIDVLSTLALALVAGFGGWLAINGQIAVGTVVAFVIYMQQFFQPIQLISTIYTQAQAALAGAERIFALLDEPITQKDKPNAYPLPSIEGHVVFEHVSFRYGQATPDQNGGDLVLRDVSLEAKPGQTVALVGPTGAGKSTLVNLIPRFYDVMGGRVLIDGHDVQQVTMASLRGQLGYVLQDSFLFSGTIADNIRYGRLDATDAEVEAAARTVGAHEFISSMSEGYQTRLGERGSGLSQGQRQLIAFARAVLADPRILILDEATSSIDRHTERIIQEALAVLLHDRTAFVIAHRLSTIRDADIVAVVDDHRIVEQGTHDELLARGGTYARLYQRQSGQRAAHIATE
ncbi:MAG: ABC transporter ATP-binding protein [Chloroflexaceae bacterium]|nr:ABC transporter ATP-binding protein [Chloroflexaceae bacterium]